MTGKAMTGRAMTGKAMVGRAMVGRAIVGEEGADLNVVRLTGRISAEPQARELPSGDLIVHLRVVVPRQVLVPGQEGARSRRADHVPAGGRTRAPRVDTIEVTCWSGLVRRSALRLRVGDLVEVHGALRRRFFRTGPVLQSRYDVEARVVRRLHRPRAAPGPERLHHP